jgi:Ca2+-binding RTX toxin-like protein
MWRFRAHPVKRLGIEPLEARRLLTIAVAWNGSVLSVVGTEAQDAIAVESIQASGGVFAVLRDAAGQLLWNGANFNALASQVSQVSIEGGAGGDWIDARLADSSHGFTALMQVSLRGGSGNDTLHGTALADQLWGGSDADVIYGYGDSDTIIGDKGDDTLYGGDGDDLFDDVGDGGEGNDRFFGENGNDLIRTGKGDDYADGDLGNDTLLGGDGSEGGADSLLGKDGLDLIYGNDGNDQIIGGGGNDTLWGDNGNDLLIGENGADELHGGAGRDVLAGGAAADLLFGGEDEDLLLGGLVDFANNANVALAAIAQEWGSNSDYQVRVSRIAGEPGGANAPYFLSTTSLVDDQVADTLTGNEGTDWPLSATLDQTGALESGEITVLNRRPTTSGLSNLSVSRSGTATVNLHAAYADSEDPDSSLVYAIASNSNPAFFSNISINSATGALTLGIAANAMGAVQLSILATDTGGFSISTSLEVQVPNLPPVIDDFQAEQLPQNLWSFTGRVIDEAPGGLTVVFSGLRSGSTTTEPDGWFAFDAFIEEHETGWLTALVTDTGGLTATASVEIELT